MSKTLEAMNTCDLVVDTGFKPTSLTQINMDLLNHALAQGKPVFALDKGEHRSPQYLNSDKVWTANSETGLADLINKHQVGPHGKCA